MPTTSATDDRKPIPNTPSPGWEHQMPKYRIVCDVHPAEKARFRTEPPFASASDSSTWQYGTRILKAGEIIETGAWPHNSFFPLNYSAKKTLAFFRAAMKSRLPRAPWARGQIRLSDGLSGSLVVDATPPQLQPMDLRPVA